VGVKAPGTPKNTSLLPDEIVDTVSLQLPIIIQICQLSVGGFVTHTNGLKRSCQQNTTTKELLSSISMTPASKLFVEGWGIGVALKEKFVS